MRLIGTAFITICLFGRLINCHNNNEQNKQSAVLINDKQSVVQANTGQLANGPSQQQSIAAAESLKIESRQIAAPHQMNHYNYNHDPSASNINIYTHNLTPKESAQANNPNAPIGYIKIQPMLAPLSSHHAPETQGSTSFLRITKPKHVVALSTGRRSFSLTNKLKNFMSSLFWKQFQFANYPQASSNSYTKYVSPFNAAPQYGSASGYSSHQSPSYYSQSSSNQGGGGYNSNAVGPNASTAYLASNSNNIYSGHSNTGFPPSSYQVADQHASGSNNVNTYASTPANHNANQQADSNAYAVNNNYNQPLSSASSESASSQSQISSKADKYSAANDSSASLSLGGSVNSLPLTANSHQSNNPVSMIKTSKQQQFGY